MKACATLSQPVPRRTGDAQTLVTGLHRYATAIRTLSPGAEVVRAGGIYVKANRRSLAAQRLDHLVIDC